MRDLKHDIVTKVSIGAQYSETNQANAGDAIDLQGYEGATAIFNSGVLDGADLSCTITECDTSNGSFTAVAAADLIGTSPVTFAATEDKISKTLGYKGSKRYIKLNITVANATTGHGANFSGTVILSHPRHGSAS